MRQRLGLLSSMVLFLAGVSCESREEKRKREAVEYLESRPDLPRETRDAILAGRVMLGMFPDEAAAAAGPFVYELLNAPKDSYPPHVIFSQRQNPLPGIAIRFFCCNGTQYGTGARVPFTVVFEKGQVVRILSPEERAEEDVAR